MSLSRDGKEFRREENREERCVPLLSLSPARSLLRRKLFSSREEFSSLPLLPSFSLFISLFSFSPAVFLSLLGSPRHGNGFHRKENSSLPIALPSRSLPLSPVNFVSLILFSFFVFVDLSLSSPSLSLAPFTALVFHHRERRDERKERRGERRDNVLILQVLQV